MVLGAGAVEVVGLKTITARHLGNFIGYDSLFPDKLYLVIAFFDCVAMVLRCLQAIMLLIQDIKTYFRKRLTPKRCALLLQFDQANEVKPVNLLPVR